MISSLHGPKFAAQPLPQSQAYYPHEISKRVSVRSLGKRKCYPTPKGAGLHFLVTRTRIELVLPA